ncbi:hypothetical protein KP509_13G038300 [Ceratopteris richardii]|uniref:Transmembrane protein n=1 Tax=Ceratopteris richardii TaxID=49495 RepID=A0A8T2TER0_CERRI|nr:hypothetical protein KP509_13G038300 [Ceratopteris richardii]
MCRNLSVCFLLLLSLTTIALNIYNIVVCSRALNQHSKCTHAKDNGGGGVSVNIVDTNVIQVFHGSHMKKYLIGSIVCSGLSIASGGTFPPIPHLVFAILGQSTWHLESLRPCGAATPSSLIYNIHQSLIVVWFTIAASVVLIVVGGQCSCGVDGDIGIDAGPVNIQIGGD